MVDMIADNVIASAQRKLFQTEVCWGITHPKVIKELQNLSEIYMICSKFDLAEPVFWRILELKQQIYGLIHPIVSETLLSLGELSEAKGDIKASEQFYVGALWILDQSEDFEYSFDVIARLLLKLYGVYKISDNLDGIARVESRLYGYLKREKIKGAFAMHGLPEAA